MNDLGIYLAMGREMVTRGGLADVDHFTHTVAGTHFLNGTWASQWLFFRLWQLGGYAALQLTLTAAVVATALLAGWTSARVSKSPHAAGIGGLLATWLIWQNLGLRPQLFSLPLFAGYALMSFSVRPSWKTLAGSAAIVAVWANLHGSFVIAPVLSLLVAAGVVWEAWPEGAGWPGLLSAARASREARLHAGTALAALAAGSLNPYGPAIYRYIAQNSSAPASRGLSEWHPTNLHDANGVRLFAAAAIFAVYLWRTRKLPARRDLPAIVAFGVLALTAIRHVVWTGMIWPVALCRLLAPQET